MLDVLGPAVHGDSREAKLVVEQTRRSISAMLEIEHKSENNPEKIYSTFEETLERLVEAAKAWNGEIPAESAQIILKRGLRENEDGYSFTRDIRLLLWSSSRSRLYGMPRSFYLELAKQISIPHLIVKVSIIAIRIIFFYKICFVFRALQGQCLILSKTMRRYWNFIRRTNCLTIKLLKEVIMFISHTLR